MELFEVWRESVSVPIWLIGALVFVSCVFGGVCGFVGAAIGFVPVAPDADRDPREAIF